MKKDGVLCVAREVRGFAYGGREVLRAVCDMPHGDCRAAVHLKEITHLWSAYVEGTFFPAAAREWEEKARNGVGFSFHPHTATGNISIEPAGKDLRITFSAILCVGSEVLYTRTLTTLWDAAGERQYKKRGHGLHFRKKNSLPAIAK